MTDTEDRLAKALEEQNRLLRASDRRGGCLWNLIMLLLFGVFYLLWLIGKWIVQIAWTVGTWIVAGVGWTIAVTVRALGWAATMIMRPFRKGATER